MVEDILRTGRNAMKISKIELKNVKCFSNEIISLLKEGTEEPLSMCAFVGANGAGKSTILKSVVAAFSAIDNEYQGETFTDDAVSHEESFLEVNLYLKLNKDEKEILEYQYDSIKMQYVHWVDESEDMLLLPEKLPAESIEQYANAVVELLCGEQVGFVMYYDPFRFVSDKNPTGPNLLQVTSAKDGALSSNLNKNGENSYRDFELKQWVVNMDYTRLKDPTSRNQAVYWHMIKAFELLSHPLKFETINQNGNIMFKNEVDGKQLSVDMLSDGFKSIFSIVLDIIRRLALAPDLNDEEFYMKEAVILIDEIDCHIHPKWQRKLIPALRELFPNCQFIFTTHSPYILDSLQTYEVKKVGERTIV